MLFPSIPISSLDEKPSNILWRDIACLAWDLTTPGVRGTAHEESQHLGLVSLSLMSRMVSSETNWVQSYQLPMTFQSQLWLKRKYFQFTAARLLHQPSFIYTTMHTLLGKIYTICLLCRPCGFDITPNNLPVSTKLSALNKRLLWSPLPALLAHDELQTTGFSRSSNRLSPDLVLPWTEFENTVRVFTRGVTGNPNPMR